MFNIVLEFCCELNQRKLLLIKFYGIILYTFGVIYNQRKLLLDKNLGNYFVTFQDALYNFIDMINELKVFLTFVTILDYSKFMYLSFYE